MNHPRRTRRYNPQGHNRKLRRLLPLVPVALLGAVWFARARLPLPQTEGDKWLWEQAESVTSLEVVAMQGGCVGICPCEHTTITDRAEIRALLRAFQHTPSFSPDPRPANFWRPNVAPSLILAHKGDASCYSEGDKGCFLGVCTDNGRYYLWRSNHTQTLVDDDSLIRFLLLCQAAVLKAHHHQAGYTTSQGRCIEEIMFHP